MGPTERRERERSELKTKILDAARELFVEQGFDAVSMRKVAERIEYSPTAIYLHFKDKSALLQEIVAADFAALAAAFQRLGRIEDPVERLVRCGRAYVEFGLAHPNHYLLMFTLPRAPFSPEDIPGNGDPATDAYVFMREAVAEAIASRRFAAADVDLVARTCWAAVHGIVSLELGAPGKHHPSTKHAPKPSAVTSMMMDMLVRGLSNAAVPGVTEPRDRKEARPAPKRKPRPRA